MFYTNSNMRLNFEKSARPFFDTYSLAYGLVDNLHPHREINNKIVNLLRRDSSIRILDAGCGTGNLIALLNDKLKNSEIYGMDISYSMLRFALKKIVNKSNRIKLVCSDMSKGLPFPNDFLTQSLAFT